MIEITKYTSPCANLTASFRDRDYSWVSQKRRPGGSRVYARVVTPGRLRRGDPVRVLPEALAAEVLTSRA